MTELHDDFVDWDAAYVLGALSTSDRAAYEQHLTECRECAEAVRGLAVIPGLLGKVSPEDVPDELSPPLPPDLLTRMRSAADDEVSRFRRRRRRLRSILAVAASAGLISVGPSGGGVLWAQRDTTPPGVTVAMQQVRSNPLSATVTLRDRPWGTEVDMKCAYAPSTAWDGRSVSALYVVDDTGHATSISTWAAGPGTTSSLSAATAVPRDSIAHLQVRTAGGTVLLSTNAD